MIRAFYTAINTKLTFANPDVNKRNSWTLHNFDLFQLLVTAAPAQNSFSDSMIKDIVYP